VATPVGDAVVDVDLPAGRRPSALFVAGHGAGGGVDARDLLAVRTGLLAGGVAVARVTQPYRVAGRRFPAPAPQLDAAWIAVIGWLRERPEFAHVPMIAAGRSSGARVACRTAAAVGAAGVVALAFPLHPPGRPKRSRAQELVEVRLPVLVVQGERDPFGAPAEFPPSADVREIPGVDHGFAVARQAPITQAEALQLVASTVCQWLRALLGSPGGNRRPDVTVGHAQTIRAHSADQEVTHHHAAGPR
jgi:predicted alpha/beta-hydrolase family hydrolase